jgi:hypothetical protein
MVDKEALEKLETCARKGTQSCPFISKMKNLKKAAKNDETIKLNELTDDARYCKNCDKYLKV